MHIPEQDLPDFGDALRRNVKPVDEFGDVLRSMLPDLKAEAGLRGELDRMLQQQVKHQFDIPVGFFGSLSRRNAQPADTGSGGGSGSGGGGRGVETISDSFNVTVNNTVQETNNPHFTAELLKNRQIAAARAMGERGGRLLGGR